MDFCMPSQRRRDGKMGRASPSRSPPQPALVHPTQFLPPHHTPTLPPIGYLPALSPPKKLFPSPSFHSSFRVANQLLSNRQASLCGHYTKPPHSSLLPKLEMLGLPQTLCAAGWCDLFSKSWARQAVSASGQNFPQAHKTALLVPFTQLTSPSKCKVPPGAKPPQRVR